MLYPREAGVTWKTAKIPLRGQSGLTLLRAMWLGKKAGLQLDSNRVSAFRVFHDSPLLWSVGLPVMLSPRFICETRLLGSVRSFLFDEEQPQIADEPRRRGMR
jgi:hypothetical protein